MPSFVVKQGLLAVGLMLCVSVTLAQVITSVKDGKWSSPSTWSGGTVPDAENSSQIIVEHTVVITDTVMSIDQVVVHNDLTIQNGAEITILNSPDDVDLLVETGNFQVYGTLIGYNSSSLATDADNTWFHDGSIYRHASPSSSVIPIATWAVSSTLEITGLVSGPFSWATSNLDQTFGNVVYNCPQQSVQFVDFSGRLRHVQGDLTVLSTNGNYLRFSASQNLDLTVGGDVRVEGASRVWFSMSAENNNLSIGGDFIYTSESSSISYFTTTGYISAIIEGTLEIDTPGRLSLSSNTDDGRSDLYLRGDLILSNGEIVADGSVNSVIYFLGTSVQRLIRSQQGTDLVGRIQFVIVSDAILDLGESVISNTESGSIIIQGRLLTSWSGSNGGIETGITGNVRVADGIEFTSDAIIEYNGSAPQFIGSGHPIGVNTILNNPTTVTLIGDIEVGDLNIKTGNVNANGNTISVGADLIIEEEVEINNLSNVVLNGVGGQIVDANGHTIEHMTVQKTSGGQVQLISPLMLSGHLLIETANTTFYSDGWLTLLSTGEEEGYTAGIGTLPSGSGVEGNVVVQRYITGYGDVYRYVGAPVSMSSVASIMDDVPVTGTFSNPSVGPGLHSTAPSLFTYDETVSEWKPYPESGLASANPLTPGVGYCFFNWNGNANTVWDVDGEVNQGDIDFSLTYTPAGSADLRGYNLIGNPYPSAIVWGQEGWVINQVSPSIAVRDNVIQGFRYWDGQIGQLEDGKIALGQAFWVRTTGPEPSLTITESAKATEDATFYRKTPVDYLELSVTVGDRQDQTYVRLREGAKPGMDDYDIQKWDNDHITLSVLEGTVPMAISAVESIPCRTEMPLRLKTNNVPNGQGTLSLQMFGAFEGSIITLHDKVPDSLHILSQGAYLFQWEDNNLADRFTLTIESPTPEMREVVSPAIFCADDTVTVHVNNPQAGIQYLLSVNNAQQWFDFHEASGAFQVPGNALPDGVSVYKVVARSACEEIVLSEPTEMKKIEIEPPVVTDGIHCLEGEVLLTATTTLPGVEIRWFDTDMSGGAMLSTGEEYETPTLTKSKNYFVSVADLATGCESVKVPVTAEIIQYDEVSLQHHEGMLVSSYADGNTWYFNGVKMAGAVDDTLRLSQPGLYEVEVTVGACTSRAGYAHLVTEVTMNGERGIKVFPVPCTDYLFTVGYERGAGQIVDILSPSGVSVAYLCPWSCQGDRCSFYVESLPPGMYFLCFANDNGKHTFTRFIKR